MTLSEVYDWGHTVLRGQFGGELFRCGAFRIVRPTMKKLWVCRGLVGMISLRQKISANSPWKLRVGKGIVQARGRALGLIQEKCRSRGRPSGQVVFTWFISVAASPKRYKRLYRAGANRGDVSQAGGTALALASVRVSTASHTPVISRRPPKRPRQNLNIT